MYNPNNPGTPYSSSMVANYQWDNEGKMASMTYPGSPGPTYTYQYDNVARLNGMAVTYSGGNGPYSVATAGYGPAGQLLNLYYGEPVYENYIYETLTYNSLLQVTNMNLGSLMNMQYNYSFTQNNGRITSSNDYVTGENVTYTYDALNRLTGTSAGSMWGETYSYDGFGNLTDKTVTQAPTLGVSYDANNHQVGMTYDANGNQLWDSGQHATAYGWNMENKLVTQTSQGWPGAETWYSYDAFGRRVMKDVNPNPNGYPGFTGGTWEFYFYGITGQKLVTRMCGYSTDGNQTPGCSPSNDQHNVYFGSKLIEANWSLVVTDRLGNVRARSGGNGYTLMSYFPYGEERTVTADGVDKFGTYFRDGPGQDYAEQRYYNNGTGRFWSVDPGGVATADASTPITLNRYAYTNGDPVNFNDRHGLLAEGPTAEWCIAHPDDPACYAPCGTGGLPTQFANALLLAPDPGCGPIVIDPGGGGGGGGGAPDCGDSLTTLGLLPMSDEADALVSVLLGEDSWSLIGRNQYVNGDTVGHPTGAVITAATVGQEEGLMLDVIANLAGAHHLSLTAQVQAPGVFVGYAAGQLEFTSAQNSKVGSSDCQHLAEAILSVDSFYLDGSVARTGYNQWRSVVQKANGKLFVRKQHGGNLRVAGTDFFTVTNP
jgi:RHS repeat-associated protein